MATEGKSWSGNERNCCFLNTAQTRFADISATSGLDFLDDGRAVAVVDWDHDGDLDLLQMNRTAPQVRFMRNDWPTQNGWLALKLIGTTCNRDAIGSRVRLYRKEIPGFDSRTLYAGSSFLSQSSKWIHFGLGRNEKIEKVEVSWPGGETEIFRNLDARRRYRLIQGSGESTRVEPRMVTVDLQAKEMPVQNEVESARVVMSARATLPLLRYQTFDGESVSLNFSGPTLIQLWASWCPKCQEELQQLTQQAERFRELGLRVVALSVDGIADNATNTADAKTFIERTGFPHQTGVVTQELLDKLEILRGELFSNSMPFPIPTSFLVDPEGRLTALYLGAAHDIDVAADIQLMSADDERLRELSLPLKGRWFTEPRPVRHTSLARAYRERGYEEDSKRYLRLARPEMSLSYCSIALDHERRGEYTAARKNFLIAIRLDPRSAKVHNLFGKFLLRRREITQAFQSFSSAVKIAPDHAESHFNLATVYVLRGRLDEAEKTFERAVEITPDDAHARTALGRLLLRANRLDEAASQLHASLRADPNYAVSYVYLGTIYLRQKRWSESLNCFQQAVRLRPELADAHEGLAQIYVHRGQLPEAVNKLRDVLRLRPDRHQIAMKLAWFIATDENGTLGSRSEAVKFATQAVDATDSKSPVALDVLAAAYANTEQFKKAADTAELAAALAPDKLTAKQIRIRKAHYERQQPYRLKPRKVVDKIGNE